MNKIALVHDFLTQRGGAERVLQLLCQKFPEADVYTSVYSAAETIDLGDRQISTTKLQHLPGSARFFRLLAPFYFPAFESLDLSAYDLIISHTTSFAKAARKRSDAHHICMCHNVTRFLWDTETYLGQYQSFKPFYPVIEPIFHWMRAIDLKYAQYPDVYIANSHTVAKRIQEFYQRPSIVVNCPIDENKFVFSEEKEDFFLVSSRFLGYKRIDIIIEAFNQLGWPLVIIGEGPEESSLKKAAKENIKFLGYVDDEQRTHLMSKARAVVVAALEDYGLVPVEANASGTPVIAYGAGGVLDTQLPGITGLFFKEQSADSLYKTLREFENIQWDYHRIYQHVLDNFTHEIFFEKIDQIIEDTCRRAVYI